MTRHRNGMFDLGRHVSLFITILASVFTGNISNPLWSQVARWPLRFMNLPCIYFSRRLILCLEVLQVYYQHEGHESLGIGSKATL